MQTNSLSFERVEGGDGSENNVDGAAAVNDDDGDDDIANK